MRLGTSLYALVVRRDHAGQHRRGRGADGSAPGRDGPRAEGPPGPGAQAAGQARTRAASRSAPIADEIFDWQETGKRALARHWQGRSPSERQEFSTLFADLIERSYISKIEQYSGRAGRVCGRDDRGGPGDGPDEADHEVEHRDSHRLPHAEGGRPLARVRRRDRGRQPRVSNYRTQFNRIIQQSGYPELVNKMKAKQEELQFEAGQTKS